MLILVIGLTIIMAGTLLLIKVRKEGLGKFFSFVSWFNIILGFLMMICFFASGIYKMKNHCKEGKQGCDQRIMMKHCGKSMCKCYCFSNHGCDMDDQDDMDENNPMFGDTLMKKGDCMKKPGCDTNKSCCPKMKMKK